MFHSPFGRLRTAPITGSIAFTRHQSIVHQIAAQRSRIHMEAAQNGIDFLLGVVRVEGERLHDEVQDDEPFPARRWDLLERSVGIEEVLQHLADIFVLLVFRFVCRAFAFELQPRVDLDGFFIQVVRAILSRTSPTSTR